MTDTNPTRGSAIAQYTAGSLAGGVLGLLILAGVLTLMTPFYPGEQGLSIVAFAVLGSIPVLLLGAATGAFAVRAARRSKNPGRYARVCVLLYLFAIPAGAVAVYLLLPWSDSAAQQRRNLRVRDMVGRTFATGQDSWNQVYVSRYPYTEASLPLVLGPLQYPGARLESWKDVEGPVSGWNILTTTNDHPDDVLAFYASVLPRGIEGYPPGALASGRQFSWSTHSGLLPSIDDVEARVTLEGDASGMRIRYTFYSPVIIVRTESAPWSSDHSAFLADARAKRLKYLRAIEAEYADWIYPRANLAWGGLASRKELAYETYDSIEQVLQFYERLKGEAQFSSGQYRFSSRGSEWTPEFSIYPVGDRVRIHFRYLQ